MTEEIGRTYAGRYRIEGELGRGGMAVVYLAFDTRMKRRVALKVLYPHLALRDEHKVRFQREAEVVANLNHRNIVRIHDYSGGESAENFIVAEYVEGTTLKRFAAENPLVLPEVGAMMAHEIAGALEHAHRNKVIHRDVKPENVMFDSSGVLKLMDFGIAQIKDVQQMTVTGQMIGSPAHMSPEHIEGRNLDHRSEDIFSLGTVLYLLCVGDLPFRGASAHALFKRILDVSYVPAVQANPAVGEELSSIIDRCLRKERDERYQSCAELQLALASHLRAFGFDHPSQELADFFASPRQYQENGRVRMIDCLLGKARSLVVQKRLGEAMRCFDRALCLDESRVDVIQELERLRRRVEFKRVLVRLVAPAFVFAALACGASWLWLSGTLNGLLGAGDASDGTAGQVSLALGDRQGEADVRGSDRMAAAGPGGRPADVAEPGEDDAKGDAGIPAQGGGDIASGGSVRGDTEGSGAEASAARGSGPPKEARLALLRAEGRRISATARLGWKRMVSTGFPHLAPLRPEGERVGTAGGPEGSGGPGTDSGVVAIGRPEESDGAARLPDKGTPAVRSNPKGEGGTAETANGDGSGVPEEKKDGGVAATEEALVPVIIEAYPAPTEIWVNDVRRPSRHAQGGGVEARSGPPCPATPSPDLRCVRGHGPRVQGRGRAAARQSEGEDRVETGRG
ncbi:MAG: serine/threonine protein kinase, partial [Deltaproteobacteria bacterium]|nr:serine/threonine protein kinase [Deltaproteobacteria bacterium]